MLSRLKLLFCAFLFALPLFIRSDHVEAGAMILIDAHSGEVLYEDLAGHLWHPASLTKMMTLYIALKSIRDKKIDPLKRVYISENATSQPPSKIGFKSGVKIPLPEALEGMFIRSANDLAVAIAEHVGGTEKKFVSLMNKTARELGMNGSSFANPHGLPDDRQITTARDMAILGRALLREFPDAERLYTGHFAKVRGRKYRSRNLGLLKGFRGADGIKTGYVCASGYNLAGSATRSGRQLIAVVLGGTSGNQRNNRVMDLLSRGFNYKLRGSSVAPKYVQDIKNQKLALTPPPDMTKRLCKRKGIEVVKGYQLENYSVIISSHETIKKARKNLRAELIGLRDVIYAGKGVVMRGVGGMAQSMITGLSKSDARETCLQLFHKVSHCDVIKPGTYSRPAPVKKPAQAVKTGSDKKKPSETKASNTDIPS